MAVSRAVMGAEAEKTDRSLPLSELILYSSGVGYFERNGQIDGKASVDLQFKVDDINDLLKSMVVQDLDGGQIRTVTYPSRDPLTKTLRSFGVDLTSNPTLAQLLDQLRGEEVEVLRPTPLKGTILGVEKKTEHLNDNRTVESDYLNLLTSDGLQSLPMSQLQKTKLLNERLNSELHQALQVLSSGHDTQKKTVSLQFDGQGKRRVRVGYIVQTPVWKTSYRLVLDDKEKPYLQGWAIVENTSDDDWENVKLSLVSGRPISFTMDLYQPLYSVRPVVQPELYSSLKPQVYGDAIDPATGMPLPAAQPESEARALAEVQRERLERMDPRLAARYGLAPKAATAALAGQSSVAGGAIALGRLSEGLSAGVSAAAQGAQTGELFEYAIKTPVTLLRQKSAMLPIVSEHVDGEKVAIYNERVQAKFPLNGFRLKNSTGLHLMQGPITVFDADAYAGDARIEDLAPGQERLISYALDLKTEVEPQVKSGPQELVTVKIKKGTLLATKKNLEDKTYLVRNRDQKPKTVLVEHPFRAGWELLEPKDAAERTREVYRFGVKVEPNKTEKLVVREQKRVSETLELVNAGPDVIAYYVKSKVVSPKVKEALEKAVTLRDLANKTAAEINRREQRVNEITEEQKRIRENMNRLNQSSDLYQRYVKKLDQQESEIETLRQELERFRNEEARQKRELNDYLLNLDVE